MKRVVTAVAILGGIGFFGGYFGPFLLSPATSNVIPVLGIFITGPIGVAAGFIFGFLSVARGQPARSFVVSLIACAIIYAAAVFYLCLPDDRWEATVVDIEVTECQQPTAFTAAAISRWERSDLETKWSVPRAGWHEDVPRMVEQDRGVVVTAFIHRRWDIYQRRQPWNFGELRVTTRTAAGPEYYFLRTPTGSCGELPRGLRRTYWTDWEVSSVSPADRLPTLLGLHVLRDVPSRYQSMISMR